MMNNINTLCIIYKGQQKVIRGSASLNFSKIFGKSSLNLSLNFGSFEVPIPYFFQLQGSHPLFECCRWYQWSLSFFDGLWSPGKVAEVKMKGAVLDYTAPALHQVNLLAKLDHGGKPAQLTKNFCAQLSPNNASGLTYDPIWFWVVPYSCPLS